MNEKHNVGMSIRSLVNEYLKMNGNVFQWNESFEFDLKL